MTIDLSRTRSNLQPHTLVWGKGGNTGRNCMASADMRWLFYSGERIMAHGPLVFFFFYLIQGGHFGLSSQSEIMIFCLFWCYFSITIGLSIVKIHICMYSCTVLIDISLLQKCRFALVSITPLQHLTKFYVDIYLYLRMLYTQSLFKSVEIIHSYVPLNQ